MTPPKRLSTRRLVVLGTSVALFAGGAAIRTAVRPLMIGRLPR